MENNNNEMERLYAETFQCFESGTIMPGRVVGIKQDGVIVDIGYKSEGFVNFDEFTPEERDNIKLGDVVEVYVINIRDSEGVVNLSRERASKTKVWEELEKASEDGSLVSGVITDKTKGGLNVDLGGVKAFLPGSQIDIRIVRDLNSLIGRQMDFKVLKINNRRSNVIVSRRAVLEEQRAKQKGETIGGVKAGALLEGTVKNITDYGVFVDLGGIDGLLHISDISWGRITHPSEFFVVGDTIEVVVLKYDEATERITLGYKQKYPDPWTDVDVKYPAGKMVKGAVVSITDYGVFIRVEEGLEGLVHISELDWSPKMKHPSKLYTIGETVEAVVLKVDRDDRKLSLSIKQTKPSPWEIISTMYSPGMNISGKVKSLTDFGAFIGLPEGVDGLLHISDLSWTKHVKHPSELLKKGQKVDVVILSIDPANEKMSLGLKQLETDPWLEEIPLKFKMGDEVRGKALRLTDFGIFVELEGGVEGLIYSSETAQLPEGETIKEGALLDATVIKIDSVERKIGLSMKKLKGPPA
ncbi:MAG: 30S ribosomal protein S1 [Nitrospirae bacterium]|nr:30S ribosomal protein S1 [Nitrospirota bacterium]